MTTAEKYQALLDAPRAARAACSSPTPAASTPRSSRSRHTRSSATAAPAVLATSDTYPDTGGRARARSRATSRLPPDRGRDLRARRPALLRECTRPLLPLQDRAVRPAAEGRRRPRACPRGGRQQRRRPARTIAPGAAPRASIDVVSPLADVGLTKSEIRALARELTLPNWDKPSMACLASRFPYGEPITDDGLARVAAAENALVDLGLRQFRVRTHGTVARIEVAARRTRSAPGACASRIARSGA